MLKYKSRNWKAKAFGRVTHVEITNANMNLLVQKKIYVYGQELRLALKRWNEKIKKDPVTYAGAVPIEYGEQPPFVLEAMFDMIYTLGRSNFLGYPKMLTAIGQRDWARAAEQSNRPQLGAERNQAIKTLFLGAPADPMFAEAWEPARDLFGTEH